MVEDEVVGRHHQCNEHENLGKLWEMMRDSAVWHATVHGVVKSWTQLGD